MVFELTRRRLIAGVTLAGATLATRSLSAAPVEPAVRATGTHTRLPGWRSGGTFVACGTRTFTRFPRPVRRLKLVVPTFSVVDGPPVADADIVAPMRFQFGIDEAATPSLSDVPERRLVTFGGVDVAEYTPGAGPFGCIVSDWFELSQPRRSISLFSVQEWTEGAAPAPGMMPRNTAMGTGKAEHHELLAHSERSLIGSRWASAQPGFGPETVQAARGFTPYLIAEFEPGEPSILLLGSSTGAGIGETVGGTGQYRANRGDAHGNRGWLERWFDRGAHIAFSNVSRGGDRLKDHSVEKNTARRLVLAQALNPTHAALQLGPNDFAGSTLDDMQSHAAAIKYRYTNAIPGLKWIGVTSTPRSLSRGGKWLAKDGSDQTPRIGSGPGSNHDVWNRMIREGKGVFADQAGSIDPCPSVEMPPLGSGLFLADGITGKWMTADGVHLTGDGTERIVAGFAKIPPSIFS